MGWVDKWHFKQPKNSIENPFEKKLKNPFETQIKAHGVDKWNLSKSQIQLKIPLKIL